MCIRDRNDTIGICDELRIYPYTIETDEDYTMDIKVKKGTELEWSGSVSYTHLFMICICRE